MIEIATSSLVGLCLPAKQFVPQRKPGHPQGVPLHGMGVYDPDIHNRRSMRLKGYDYSQAGAYLVTVVTQERLTLFGDVLKGRMQLNPAGEMVQRIWKEMPDRFPHIVMDTFIAMPNHVHGIIILAGAGRAGTQNSYKPSEFDMKTRATTRVAPTVDGRTRLGNVVGVFKSLTTLEYTRGVRDMNWLPFKRRLWQRNFYEHIVRTDASLQKYRKYIVDNPVQWPFDRENPRAASPMLHSP